MSRSIRTISRLSTLLLAGGIFGALSSPSLTAAAADIPGSSTYSLISRPPVALVNAVPIRFGQNFIPREGTASYEVNPVRDTSKARRVTFTNADSSHVYSWGSSDPNCPPHVSLRLSQAYNNFRAAGLIVPVPNGPTELYFGGTLSVGEAAAPGPGVCTFDITFTYFGEVPSGVLN